MSAMHAAQPRLARQPSAASQAPALQHSQAPRVTSAAPQSQWPGLMPAQWCCQPDTWVPQSGTQILFNVYSTGLSHPQ